MALRPDVPFKTSKALAAIDPPLPKASTELPEAPALIVVDPV